MASLDSHDEAFQDIMVWHPSLDYARGAIHTVSHIAELYTIEPADTKNGIVILTEIKSDV